MKLYHLTSLYHLPAIMAAGYLKTTESNVSLDPRQPHAGPDVVWLTTSPRTGQGWARMRDEWAFVDKTRILFEVAIDAEENAVQPWYDWARAQGSTDLWMTALAASGDEQHSLAARVGTKPEADAAALERARQEWYVVERTVPWLEWVSITDTLAGTTIWRQTLEQQKAGAMTVSKLWTGMRHQGDATLMISNDKRGFVPTTIISEETGEAFTVDPKDVSAEDVSRMSPAQRRAYFNRVAPSINVMRDLTGMDN